MRLVKIVIPLYTAQLSENEWLSLRHNIALLEDYPIVLLISEDVDTSVFTAEFPECQVMSITNEWLGSKNGILGYNRMMLSKEFYDLFADCDYILICQTDAWIFRDELREWCMKGYDYVGGIWWRRGLWSWPLIRHFFPTNRKLYAKVGNGGLSLRRVDSFRRACDAHKERICFYLKQQHHIYAEDVFWAIEPQNFVRPKVLVANAFAFDSHPDLCMRASHGKLPFGCHGWLKPMRINFWKNYIMELNQNKTKRYILYVTLPYAYSILRPLEQEIRRRGDQAAWYVEETCPLALEEGEVRLKTLQEAVAYDPIAVFTPGNYIPDFIPGVKVALFHGYAIQKRKEEIDDHFTIRGWFDIYCTQGPSSTPFFKEQEKKYGFFRVYETGWPKADTYFAPEMQHKPQNKRPVILYPPTFTRNVCSAPHLMKEIEKLAKTRPWDWIITFHPKLTDPDIIAGYKKIAAENDNVIFYEGTDKMPLLQRADVMLCDSSSIILEFMFLDKPVVTFRNSHPGPHLIDVDSPEAVGPAIEEALTRPEKLMNEIRTYTMHHEPHRDGHCSARVLDAVDDFIAEGHKGLKKKPRNLVRKFKLRRQLHYPLFGK